ncbi:MAG: S41 family peptidase [Chitinophagales bacterium]|nr:S41 family peptidase [Chitinophagales bacterium]
MPFVFALIMVMGIFLGFQIREFTGGKKVFVGQLGYDRLEEVMSLIKAKYVDTLNSESLSDKTISQLLSNLDPHSYFIPASEVQGVKESLEGNFEGIGIEFYLNKDTIFVVSPISGGPSEAVGIKAGDKIIKIEDSTVAGVHITNDQVMKKLRGKKGTEVKVTVARLGSKKLIDFTIVRDKIPLFSVDAGYMVDKEIGYIRVNRFAATTYEEFMKELTKLKKAGMSKLILDLRQNPGGILEIAIMMADEFISGRQLLLYTEGKSEKRRDYTAKADGDFEGGDIVVLIDEGSASASEIVAGALQDWDRGLIIGRRSFGKGLVQEQFPLSDGSEVRLTVARYYTPSGRCIQKPYGNDLKDYYDETNARFEHGEFQSMDSLNFPDSLKYKTIHGRTVYGGGGIVPDIFVPLDTANWLYMAEVRSHIPQFVYSYYFEHQKEFEAYKANSYFRDNFQITDQLYRTFLNYAEKEGLEIDAKKLRSIDKQVKTTLKASIARQMWKEEGYYSVINEIDPTFQKAYLTLKDPKAVTLLRPHKAVD